ncbi:uncharacterized protein LOC124191086 [Daphnia pulex]|uniref:uncharacterized protein LOC124191086 n=1 Tax=Daphnia pulex TaxID=6669 RepID=UPI001EDE8CDD|nr:uncharacterized protein LOC124191086 [Daphnia pulex]
MLGEVRAMAFGESARQNTISIGDGSSVVHHTVKSEILNRCPAGSPLAAMVKNINKGARSNHGMRWSPSSDTTKGRDGHSFAYILHYLSTGDLIYPLHEGFHRVDVLLKELTFFGLVEDVIRYATQEGSGRSKQNRRRSVLFTTRDTQSERKVETLPKRVPMAKCQSIQDVHFIGSCSTGRVAGVDVVQSVSMSDLNMERAENEIREQPSTEKCSRTTNIQHGNRFLNAIKRYLSLKSSGSSGSHRQNGNKRNSDGPNKSAAIWSPRQVNTASGGVFRPNSARGSTLILIATPDSVTVFGQRNQLEMMLPDFPIEALRSFSSAFIDSKLVYQPDDTSSGGDIDGYSSSSFTSVSSLPKRSSSTSSESTAVPTTAHSDLLFRLFQRHIQPLGFNVTVQSHWRSNDTLETHHQWLLHKKHNSKQSIGTSSGRRRHTHAGMASAMSTTTINQQTSVTRRASVLQRLFNKSALTLHTDL